MVVSRPTREQLESYAQHFDLHLSSDDLDSFSGLIDGSLASYDNVDALYDAYAAPTVADRAFEIPTAADNPLGAWYVKTDISTGGGGPLSGKRIAIKDNVEVSGLPMMNGSRTLEGFTPSRDATIVTRLLAAGATITGKSVCEDLCFSGSSFTSASGPVRNPWDLTRSAGGSSSGSAALVASGEVDMAIGGDQGGSIRIPAAFCGVVGHKPTHGLVPYTGAFPIERTIDHVGPIAPTVRDAALMLSVLAGRDGKDPRQGAVVPVQDYLAELDKDVTGLRIGIVTEGFGSPVSESGVDEIVRAAAHSLTEAGCIVEEVSIPWHTHTFDIWNVIATDGGAYQMVDGNGYGMNAPGDYDPEMMAHFAAGKIEHADELSETVKLVELCGRHGGTALGGVSYAKARNLVKIATEEYDKALDRFDVLVMPTLPYVANELLVEGDSREVYIQKALSMIANTAPFDVTGHPATSVPAGLSNGLPVGAMFIGKHFDDATVLRVAQALEKVRGAMPSPAKESQSA